MCKSLEILSCQWQDRKGSSGWGRDGEDAGVSLCLPGKENKPTWGPLCIFLPLQSLQVQLLCVIDANDPPKGPARRISNWQMMAFAGATNHGASQSNAKGPGSLKDLG